MPASNRRNNAAPRHAPTQMSRAYNVMHALMKIDTAPLHTLTPAMLDSIARTHRVPVEDLLHRLDERRRREVGL